MFRTFGPKLQLNCQEYIVKIGQGRSEEARCDLDAREAPRARRVVWVPFRIHKGGANHMVALTKLVEQSCRFPRH